MTIKSVFIIVVMALLYYITGDITLMLGVTGFGALIVGSQCGKPNDRGHRR